MPGILGVIVLVLTGANALAGTVRNPALEAKIEALFDSSRISRAANSPSKRLCPTLAD